MNSMLLANNSFIVDTVGGGGVREYANVYEIINKSNDTPDVFLPIPPNVEFYYDFKAINQITRNSKDLYFWDRFNNAGWNKGQIVKYFMHWAKSYAGQIYNYKGFFRTPNNSRSHTIMIGGYGNASVWVGEWLISGKFYWN